MAGAESNLLQQVRVKKEPSFCNLGNSANGYPNLTALHAAAGLCIANPEFSAQYAVAQNESVRNRAYMSTPTLLTRDGEVSGELYVRGNGAPEGAFSDPVYDVLDAFFGLQANLLREDDVEDFASVSTLAVVDAYESGWRAGMGFYILLPTGHFFVGFIQSIVNEVPTDPDVLTFDPPMTAAELAACSAATGLKIRGGRTYGLGDKYAANSSVFALLLKQAYAELVWGCVGNTFQCNLEAGKEAKFNVNLMGSYTHNAGYCPSKTIVDWVSATEATIASNDPNIKPGQIVQVTRSGTVYILQIKSHTGTTILFEPSSLPAGIATDNPVPALVAVEPGATTDPNGAWLVFLNARVYANGGYKDVRVANWQINLNPVRQPTQANQTGAAAVVCTPEVMCDLEYSAFDDGVQFENLKAGTQYSVLCALGDGTEGDVVALYSPKMHNREAPEPGEADGLITLPTQLGAGNASAEQDAYGTSGSVSNTTFRLFIGW